LLDLSFFRGAKEKELQVSIQFVDGAWEDWNPEKLECGHAEWWEGNEIGTRWEKNVRISDSGRFERKMRTGSNAKCHTYCLVKHKRGGKCLQTAPRLWIPREYMATPNNFSDIKTFQNITF
jgi:hypothetical protein